MDCTGFIRSYSKICLISLKIAFSISIGIFVYFIWSTQTSYNEYIPFLSHRYTFVSILLLLTVIGIIFIVIFGIIATVFKNSWITNTFFVFLVVIFLLEVSAGISGFVLRFNSENVIFSNMNETIQLYNNSNHTDVTKTWDRVQNMFHCCGIYNSTDWIKSDVTNHTLPLSCCNIPAGTSNNFTCTTTNNYDNGCLSEFGSHIRSIATSVGATCLVLSIFQLMGVVFSCFMKRSEREYESLLN